jgi:hypothetical protein
VFHASPIRAGIDLRGKFLRVIVALFILTAFFPLSLNAQKSKPLAAKDVMDLLRGNVASKEITRQVVEHGIGFRMSDDLEDQFRGAGATDELINALREASKPEDPPPVPAPSPGIIKIESQPGEAQVYVNGDLKGMTSPAGDLRLTGMPAGTYRVRVVLAGYKPWENPIPVATGETVTIFAPLDKPVVAPAVSLDADRYSIQPGQSVTLRWSCENAADVSITPGMGKLASTGSMSVAPHESTTYTLTASGAGGVATATIMIRVLSPSPAIRPGAGNLLGFPVPGASFKEIRFFPSEFRVPPASQRTYQLQFDHRTTHFVAWEIHLACSRVAVRADFPLNITWYNPDGVVFGNDTLNESAAAGLTELVYASGRGWQQGGMWNRGTYRVEFSADGNLIGSGSFIVY